MPKKSWLVRKKKSANYDQNDGIAGVVYILANSSLATGHYKIGCSRYSGAKRAEDLNKQAGTSMPAQYKCVFQVETRDCGLAEKRVFDRLDQYRVRTAKIKQEFFRVDLKIAKKAVLEECEKVDAEKQKKKVVAPPLEEKPVPEKKPLEKAALKGTRVMSGRYDILKHLGTKK